MGIKTFYSYSPLCLRVLLFNNTMFCLLLLGLPLKDVLIHVLLFFFFTCCNKQMHCFILVGFQVLSVPPRSGAKASRESCVEYVSVVTLSVAKLHMTSTSSYLAPKTARRKKIISFIWRK